MLLFLLERLHAKDYKGDKKKIQYEQQPKKENKIQIAYKIRKRTYLRPGSHGAERTTIHHETNTHGTSTPQRKRKIKTKYYSV